MVQYDKLADKYGATVGAIKQFIITPLFHKLVGNIEGKRVLDLACGTGYFTALLAEKKPTSLIGIDISPEMIRKAKELHPALSFKVGDVRLPLDDTCEVANAVFLVNYARTVLELEAMFKNIAAATTERFVGVTVNPGVKPQTEFTYESKYTHPKGLREFKDGDVIWVDIQGQSLFRLECTYWSKETYESAMRKAGFSNIEWVLPEVSPEGIAAHGEEFWQGYFENPKQIGFVCTK